jgi:hypothetical protein
VERDSVSEEQSVSSGCFACTCSTTYSDERMTMYMPEEK